MHVDAFGAVTVSLGLDLKSIPAPLYPSGLPSAGPNPPPKIQGFGGVTVVLELDLKPPPKEEAFGPVSVTATGELFLTSITDPEAFGPVMVERSSTQLAGVLFTNLAMPELLIFAPLPGRNEGRPCPPPPHVEVADMPPPVAPAKWFAGGMTPPGGVAPGHPGTLEDLTIGGDWFDRVHILPRERIDFERFVTPVSAEYEIVNAHHHRTMTLVSITDTSKEGLVLDDVPTLPYKIPPFNSLLSSASVRFAPKKATVSTKLIGSRKF